MGYYYDWLEARWSPIDHDRKLSRRQLRRIEWRGALIEALIELLEQEGNSSEINLYGGLLARALTASDELLIRGIQQTSRRTEHHGEAEVGRATMQNTASASEKRPDSNAA